MNKIWFYIFLAAFMPCIASAQDTIPIVTDSTKNAAVKRLLGATGFTTIENPVINKMRVILPDSLPVSEIRRVLAEKIKPLKSAYSLDKLKSIKNIPGDIFKKPFQFNGLSISSNGFYNDQVLDNIRIGTFLSNSAHVDVAILGIPLSAGVFTQYFSESHPSGIFSASTNYSREQYLNVLREKLKGKVDPEDFLPKALDPIDILKAEAENRVKSEINAIRNKYGDLLNNQLSGLGDPSALFNMDMNTIRQRIMGSGFLDSVSYNLNLLNKLQEEKLLGHSVDSFTLNRANVMLDRYKASMELVSNLKTQYDKWNESGLLNAVRKNELMKKQKINDLLKNPDLVMKLAKEKLNLGGFQRMMMNFNSISVGQHTLNQSALSMQGMLTNGLQLEMLKNNRYLSGVFGKEKTYNTLLDMPFSANIVSNDYRYGGITFGKGLPGGQHSHFTLMTFGQSAGMNTFGVDPVMVPRNSIVTTFSKAFNTGKTGFLNFDVSKSSNQFKGEWDPVDSSLVSKNPLSNYLEGSFVDNMALSIQHEGFWEEAELQHSIMVRTTGRNYQNPGAAFIPAGSKEVLAYLKKSFFKKKMQVSVRENIRENSFGSSQGDKWRNMQTSLDVKWKMRKGQYFSLRYTPTNAVKIANGFKTSLNSTQRMSAEFNYRKRLGKLNYSHFVNLAYQQSNYDGLDYQPIAYTSVLITSLQTLQLGLNSLYCNLNFNRVNNSSDIFYLNSSMNVDLGMQYLVFRKVSFSTAINMNGVSGWYNQVGVKQTIAGQINDFFSFSAYVDLGKNLKVERPMYNNTFRTDFSLQYVFGK